MDRRDFLATKGTPHSILLALIVEGPQTAADLAVYVAMDERTVGKSLALLEGLGLVRMDGSRWALLATVEPAGIASAGHKHALRDVATSANAVRVSLPPSPPPTTLKTAYRQKEREEEEEKSAKGAKTQNRIYRLLLEAGVGPRSPKMRQLLEMGLSPDYVEAHVIHREELLERGVDYPVNHLIQALQCGDPVPAMPKERGHIPAKYADVVMR